MLWPKVSPCQQLQRQNCVVGKRSERQKEKTKTTEVVGEIELPLKPMREDEEEVEDSIPNETNPFLRKRKRANVFNVKIKYPPSADEKKEIKRINTENIFPELLTLPMHPDLDKRNIEYVCEELKKAIKQNNNKDGKSFN